MGLGLNGMGLGIGGQNVAAISGGGGGGTPLTWNPADKTASMTLTNGNKTAANGAFDGVRATPSFTGKKYWEVHVDTVAAAFCPGVGDSTTLLTTDSYGFSANPNGASYRADGSIPFNGTAGTAAASYTTGDVISFAVDEAGKLFWTAKNNVWQFGSPSAGTGGVSISNCTSPLYPMLQINSGFGAGTARFAAADQSFTPPTGFSAFS